MRAPLLLSVLAGAAIGVPCSWTSDAHAQRRPVVQTPNGQLQQKLAPVLQNPQNQQGQAPKQGQTNPGNAGAQGAQPTQPTDPNDPMSAVKQAPKEIEFEPLPGNYEVSFNLDDADLPELVKAISNITGKRFIYGGKLRQITATVYAPEKVTAAEAYRAFLSILETNGMTVIPHGQFLKIVETAGVPSQTTPVYGTATPVPAEDRYITRLYRLRNIDANEIATVLTKFKTKDADITVYGPSNLLIITETGSNIRRMLRIVEEVDVVAGGDQIWIQPVHNGSAADLAAQLNEILGSRGAAAGVFADERTNSLVITASKEDYEKILELLKRIDVPLDGEGQIHVLPLQHATCADLSTTLNDILGGATAAPQPGRPATPGPGAPENIFEGQVRVTCDEATNSLITTSSGRDYAQLRNVVDQLDMARRQVFIEAVIMDLNVERTFDWGIGYHGGGEFDVNGEQSFFYGGNNPGQSILGVPANLEALALGLRGPEIDGSQNLFGTGVSIPALGVVLHALAGDGDSNVLATPHILATDNIPAEISIGQNIPLQTNIGGGQLGQLAQAAGGAGGAGGLGSLGLLGGLGFNAPRQDVGTRISVTPHVNDSDQVRLELTEEISDAGSPTGALGAIPINKRTATTTLIVKDQQTVVIGGLVRDAYISGETKIPILGDIPVLGFLFRQENKTKVKTNLLLILTPHVIRDQTDLRRIFERKMQERQEFLDRYFVFSDARDWEPPRDFNRSNGLVETIRQQMIMTEERARLLAESEPANAGVHEPTAPIAMPSVAKPSSPTTSPRPSPTPAARPTPRPQPPQLRQPTQRNSTRRTPTQR